MKTLDILGCRVDAIDADEATARIMALAREHRTAQIVTLGTEMVVHAQRDERFRAIVNAATLSLCDTVGVLAVARRRGMPLTARVTGVELVERLCADAASNDLPVYLLGGAPGVAAEAAAALRARFPGLRVAGTRDGFFRDDEAASVAAEVAGSGARVLFVGMGFPRQEYWLAEHLAQARCVGVGVGGSFDVIADRITRAPRVVRRLGVEWLYRLVREPWRWRRQLALPHFVWLIVLDELRPRRTQKNTAA
ncbi:MAG: WecB/TagA/CpsF family glycosyltransferase [Candidatus Eremiobacteraeota bacterium]|nr:WecB/TagA/CpsF family glycosyltransferase [Candidatus Eremiobacteraeota bacterium]MBV9056738.1 WecB/TagA/CpsF family glycosyltransferase [Candidatus Eremiobacteraeota bacterium]